MDLTLAIAEVCESAACRVRTIDDGVVVEARYGARVQDQVKVRPGDLVAVDRGMEPPRVVWRWWHGTVERLLGERVTVSRNHSQPTPEHSRRRVDEMPLPAQLAGGVRPGDTVFFASIEAGVLDVALPDGAPAHPERLTALLPRVVEAYAGMAG